MRKADLTFTIGFGNPVKISLSARLKRVNQNIVQLRKNKPCGIDIMYRKPRQQDYFLLFCYATKMHKNSGN